MTKPDEPAFPRKLNEFEKRIKQQAQIRFGENDEIDGLTKREWFAGLAMQGLMAVGPHELIANATDQETGGEYVARQSVAVADFLIAELSKEK